MKRFIKWLARISGVEWELRAETIREIGGRFNHDHYWWNGGITFRESKTDVMNAFYLYGKHMKEYGTYPDIMWIREEVYKLNGEYIGNKKS